MAKVIAVHSFKGGTGKTTLTANLAAILAMHHRVGVMDLDLSGPGLHVLFGLKKGEVKATLTDIFLGDANPADVIIDLTPRFPKLKGGLYFCPASNKVEDMLRLLKAGLEVTLFQDTLQKVGEQCNLDYIIVDTHPGVENDTVLAMGCCDALVLVSRVDQQDLFGTAVMVLLAETFGKPTFLTLNVAPPGVRNVGFPNISARSTIRAVPNRSCWSTRDTRTSASQHPIARTVSFSTPGCVSTMM